MRTVDVRLLVDDDVRPEVLAEQLVMITCGPGAPRGAALLGGDRYGRLASNAPVWRDENVVWSGEVRRPNDDVARDVG